MPGGSSQTSAPAPATRRVEARTAADTEALGARVAAAGGRGLCLHLLGELAAGKTTFARGYLRGLGHRGAVKSPTFTLVETYRLDGATVHHFDLYRLADPEELEYIGIDDYFDEGADCLIEWADRGAGIVPPCDLEIRLEVPAEGRVLTLTARSGPGLDLISRLFSPELSLG